MASLWLFKCCVLQPHQTIASPDLVINSLTSLCVGWIIWPSTTCSHVSQGGRYYYPLSVPVLITSSHYSASAAAAAAAAENLEDTTELPTPRRDWQLTTFIQIYLQTIYIRFHLHSLCFKTFRFVWDSNTVSYYSIWLWFMHWKID